MSPGTPAAIPAGFDLQRIIHDGGFIMWPLIACSVLALTVILERAWALRAAISRGKALADGILADARGRNLVGAIERCRRAQVGVAAVFEAGLTRAAEGQSPLPALERARARVGAELKSGLWILGTIGAAAPFVGLFGTVVGILESFQAIGRSGQGGFATVASGISEALVATAAGIAVAVFAFAANNFLQIHAGAIAREWRLAVDEVAEVLEHLVRAAASPPAPLAPALAASPAAPPVIAAPAPQPAAPSPRAGGPP